MQHAKISPKYDLNRLVDKWGFERIEQPDYDECGFNIYYEYNYVFEKTNYIKVSGQSRSVKIVNFAIKTPRLINNLPQIIIDLTLDGLFEIGGEECN